MGCPGVCVPSSNAGRSGESWAVVPRAGRCSYLNHNQEADGEEEEVEALHLGRILGAAFRNEHRAVCSAPFGCAVFESERRGERERKEGLWGGVLLPFYRFQG